MLTYTYAYCSNQCLGPHTAPPTAFACRTMSIFCLPKFISQPASNAHICGFDCQQRIEQDRNYPPQQKEMELGGGGWGLVGWWVGQATWRPAQFLTPCRDAADYCHDKFQRLKPSGGGAVAIWILTASRFHGRGIFIVWQRASVRETAEGQRQQQEYDLTRPLGILHRQSVGDTHSSIVQKIDSPVRNLQIGQVEYTQYAIFMGIRRNLQLTAAAIA